MIRFNYLKFFLVLRGGVLMWNKGEVGGYCDGNLGRDGVIEGMREVTYVWCGWEGVNGIRRWIGYERWGREIRKVCRFWKRVVWWITVLFVEMGRVGWGIGWEIWGRELRVRVWNILSFRCELNIYISSWVLLRRVYSYRWGRGLVFFLLYFNL